MILFVQAAPLLMLLGLLLSGRAGPVLAVVAALAAAIPAAMISLPPDQSGAAFLATEALRGVFLASQPIGVVIGGLLFHAAVARDDGPVAAAPDARRIFIATLLMGAFMESVTGFAVGAVFALATLRAMGIGGAPAGALALLSLCLVPWGGLGPGTLLGAALIGAPAQEVARIAAWPNAAWLLVLGPVCWRLTRAAGIDVPSREKMAQMAMLVVVAALLVAGHIALPFEVLGILSTGVVLVYALWRLDPPRSAADWRRAARALAPYLLLTAALLVARAIPDPPAYHPWPDLPAFRITHVAVVLTCVAALLLASRDAPLALARGAIKRAGRPALVLLLYVLLARWLSGSGATPALAQAAADALGPFAPYAVPPLGLLSGLVTGSNVGSNAALMPMQYRLGLAAGLPPLLAPGLHNFAGAAGAGMSFGVCALICGLLADGTRPTQLWRLLLPSLISIVIIGWIALVIMA